MNFVSKISALPNLLMNKFSSVFLASDYVSSFLDTDTLFTRILRWILQLFYFAAKWMMYMIDVMYFYLLQLVGITTDTTIFDSSRTDPTFRLLIDNKEEVTRIIKNFLAIAIIIIIVTAIIALIKQQAQSFKNMKSKTNPTAEVMKRVLRSVLLLILTPVLAILGIMASSVILQGLYRATNLSDAKSLSGRIFNASATAANKYKAYADNGVRIPIKYHFSDEETRKDAIYYTSSMLASENFPSLSYFNENENHAGDFVDPVLGGESVKTKEGYGSAVETWVNETYYQYFDRSEDYNPSFFLDKQKVMITHRNEYYVMSDVIGYALDTMEPFYFVTIQELLESAVNADMKETPVTYTNIKSLADSYKVRLLDEDGDIISQGDYAGMARKIKDKTGYSFIQYTSRYADGEHTYIHIKDAVDELEGAKFVMAYKLEMDETTESSIYGDYILDNGTLKKVEKFYYKKSSTARYQKVDLYYTFNGHNGKFEKAKTIAASGVEYYYKLGEDYILIKNEDRNKFYYKDDEGDYKALTSFGMSFTNKVKFEYYMPLASGISVDGNLKFSSHYIESSNIITARGIFDDASYPTAIRRLANGNIMFYRDDLEVVADGDVSGVGSMEEIEAEKESDNNDSGGFFSNIGSTLKSFGASIKKFVTSIWDPLKMIPDLNIDESNMETTYTNKTNSVAELEDGKLHISYFFSDNITSWLNMTQYTFDLNQLFEPLHINYVILIVGSTILFRILVTGVFGIINRALNLFILFLIYPVACSTIPLDESSSAMKKGSYAKWADRFVKLVFSTFGLMLSLNFVFIVIPVIEEINFLSPENLQNNNALARIATALTVPRQILNIVTGKGGLVAPNYDLICELVNKILRIIFQIAAFSLVVGGDGKNVQGKENFYTVIQNIVKPGGEGVLETSPVKEVKKTLTSLKNTVVMMVNPVKTVKNFAEKGVETVKEAAGAAFDMIPGSAVAMKAIDKMTIISIKDAQAVARKALKAALESGASDEEIQDKMKDFQNTHKGDGGK